MRNVPPAMTNAWKAQAKTGDRKPVVRATIQKANLRRYDYDTALAAGGDVGKDRHRRGLFTSVIFGDPSPVKEIPNIKNYSWNRTVDQDVATCTLTLKNVEITPVGSDLQGDDFDQPGFLTYNRGEQKVGVNRWGYDEAASGRPNRDNGWQGVFVPDRMVRTYEGYGSNPDVPAALDENLVQSGTWLIDNVTYTADGDITLEMRDVGRILLDQIVFPPVVPMAEYPLTWEKIRSMQVPGRAPSGGSYQQVKGTASSSNGKYIGKGLTDPFYGGYVGPSGGVNGHHPSDPLRDGPGYWWSTGQTTARSKVWWQVDLKNAAPITALRINPAFGPYRIYISIKVGNKWVGKRKIPYNVTTEGINVAAGIPFVESVLADKRNPFDVVLKRKYRNVTAIRLTFTNLTHHRGDYPFRAGLKNLKIYTASNAANLGYKQGYYLKAVGNYRDYTDIVKWICAWGGFYWPPSNTDQDFIQLSRSGDNTPGAGRRQIAFAQPDPVLPKGRVWGDFMKSGTAGEAKLTVDLFDKQPLMDVINYVRDVLGFIFFIDETGGVVWRLPNLGYNVAEPKLGNYLSPTHLGQRTRARTGNYVTIDEEETLLDYSTTLSSENIRERIFIASTTGKIGTVIRGYHPTFTHQGFRRMAGWTDQNFASNREARVMGDMIAAQQMFDYRRASVTIPGYPAIQIDDQIRIFERVTNETFFHYVLGITSELDMETGVWTYKIDAHWLGERPSDAWVVRVEKLDWATRMFLNAIEA